MDLQTASEQQLVIFSLSTESYGVEIASVHEIVRMQHITQVPGAPQFVEGVTNLRGKVIPVVDLSARLGLGCRQQTMSSRIVVVEVGEHLVGIVVDGVSEVLRISSDIVEPPSVMVTELASDFLRGIARLEGRLIILLSIENVIPRDDFTVFDGLEKAA